MFLNCVLNRLKPINVIANGFLNQSYFRVCQWSFENLQGHFLNVINIYSVYDFFASLCFHDFSCSNVLLVKNVLPMPANRVLMGTNFMAAWQTYFFTLISERS